MSIVHFFFFFCFVSPLCPLYIIYHNPCDIACILACVWCKIGSFFTERVCVRARARLSLMLSYVVSWHYDSFVAFTKSILKIEKNKRGRIMTDRESSKIIELPCRLQWWSRRANSMSRLSAIRIRGTFFHLFSFHFFFSFYTEDAQWNDTD